MTPCQVETWKLLSTWKVRKAKLFISVLEEFLPKVGNEALFKLLTTDLR